MSRDFCRLERARPKDYIYEMTKRFYNALSDALDTTGMSLQQACAAAGVSYEQFKKFMQRGSKDLSTSTNVDDAVRLAAAFGVTFDELIQDDTAALRSEAAALWRSLGEAEREILKAAARGLPDQDRLASK
jgi:transcriptional regulator with XRE-family HTH domain